MSNYFDLLFYTIYEKKTLSKATQVRKQVRFFQLSVKMKQEPLLVGESGVKLQYKLAQTRPVNIARIRDDPTNVIGLYDILHFCR